MTAPSGGTVRTILRMRTLEGREAEFEAAWRRAVTAGQTVPSHPAGGGQKPCKRASKRLSRERRSAKLYRSLYHFDLRGDL